MHKGPSLVEEAKRLGIPVVRVPSVNTHETIAALDSYDIDLGISLGNGYIAPRIFSHPPLGMINVHGELLPEYAGAHSVIWPIHNGERETGFTIHKIDKGIDTGPILYRRAFDIRFGPTLKETIGRTNDVIVPEIPEAVSHILANWSETEPVPASGHGSYTTPTFRQFLRMRRNNRRFYREKPSTAE